MKNSILLRIGIYTIVSTLLVAVYVFGFIILKNKSQSIADYEASINNQISQIEQSIDDKKQSEAVAKMASGVSAYFLKSSEVPRFLSDLEAISGRTGSIINIDSVDESETELTLGITANGSYQAIYHTLVELENLPYFSNINSVSLSFSHNSSQVEDFKKKPLLQSSWTLVLKLVIKSYVK